MQVWTASDYTRQNTRQVSGSTERICRWWLEISVWPPISRNKNHTSPFLSLTPTLLWSTKCYPNFSSCSMRVKSHLYAHTSPSALQAQWCERKGREAEARKTRGKCKAALIPSCRATSKAYHISTCIVKAANSLTQRANPLKSDLTAGFRRGAFSKWKKDAGIQISSCLHTEPVYSKYKGATRHNRLREYFSLAKAFKNKKRQLSDMPKELPFSSNRRENEGWYKIL